MYRNAPIRMLCSSERRSLSGLLLGLLVGVALVVVGCGSSGGNSDTTAPNAPSNLEGIPGDQKVGLNWDPVGATDLTEYRVYRSTSTSVDNLSEDGRVSTSSNTSFTDTRLTNGTSYYYVVTAVDDAGNESGASSSVKKVPGIPSRP
jgi:fibronectin type 3 domain-containing protein